VFLDNAFTLIERHPAGMKEMRRGSDLIQSV
jgi:hypothetical protein